MIHPLKKYGLLVLLSFAAIAAHGFEGESRFHLLSMKCHPEAGSELETSPQSPPLDVDDAETPGCNKWEINVLVDGDINKDEKEWQLPLLDINYGIGDNLELQYEVPFINRQINRQTEQSSTSGVETSTAGIKAMFFQDESIDLAIAFNPHIEFTNANSEAVKSGLETPGNITTIPLLISKKIGETTKGDINLTANLGYNISSKADTTDFISAAVGLGMPLLRHTAIMGELSTEQAVLKNNDNVRDQLVKTNMGFITSVNKHFQLYASLGNSLYSSDQKGHAYVLTGVRLLTDAINQ